MNLKTILLSTLCCSIFTLNAQGIFDQAVQGKTEEKKDKPYSVDINGYIKSGISFGKDSNKLSFFIKEPFGEAELNLKTHHESLGQAIAQIRFRNIFASGTQTTSLDLREAYIIRQNGPMEIRAGKQIVVWGKADGINPTNNLTPLNYFLISADEDDRRIGNYLIRIFENFDPIRLELIFVPIYQTAPIVFSDMNMIDLPSGVNFVFPKFPDSDLRYTALAGKIHFDFSSFDASLSYYNGYSTSTNLGLNILSPTPPIPQIEIFPKSYLKQVFGADFSFNALGFGFRGEMAYTKPSEEYKTVIDVPYPDFSLVLGMDKEFFTRLTVLAQYYGRYVMDYTELPTLANTANTALMFENKIHQLNRLITHTDRELTHTFMTRISLSLQNDNLIPEFLGMYNVTSKEFTIRSQIKTNIADALVGTAGIYRMSGPRETLSWYASTKMTGVFMELKSSF